MVCGVVRGKGESQRERWGGGDSRKPSGGKREHWKREKKEKTKDNKTKGGLWEVCCRSALTVSWVV